MVPAQVEDTEVSDIYDTYPLDGLILDGEDIAAPRLEKVATVNTPTRVDVRPYCTPVENQAKIGSCGANAVVGAMECQLVRGGHAVQDLSRLFVYYNARRLDERIGQSGCKLSHAMAGILGWGACSEAMWPYQVAMVDELPTAACYKAATKLTGMQIAQTSFETGCREALAMGLPVIFAMLTVRTDWQAARETCRLLPPVDGKWLPKTGGHGMVLVGYDDAEHAWLARNSWGPDWCDGGHVWIDYDYLAHYGIAGPQGPFVLGQLEDNRAFRLAGPTLQDFMMSSIRHTPQFIRSEMTGMRADLASDLDSSLSKRRQDIRNRLRGPGAGGGY